MRLNTIKITNPRNYCNRFARTPPAQSLGRLDRSSSNSLVKLTGQGLPEANNFPAQGLGVAGLEKMATLWAMPESVLSL